MRTPTPRERRAAAIYRETFDQDVYDTLLEDIGRAFAERYRRALLVRARREIDE